MKRKIFASILSANFANLGNDINDVIRAGADGIHFDVMDNHFVPNLTIGPDVCKSLREYGVSCYIDVHLMISPLVNLPVMFAKAGADAITFHVEAVSDIAATINEIKNLGCKVGVAINPGTDIDTIQDVIKDIDNVLLMSVEPGFGGQKFMPTTIDKVIALKGIIEDYNLVCNICVDGGINPDNIGKIAAAGADSFVVGSALFKAHNYADKINELKQAML